jgi:hypothetical protein
MTEVLRTETDSSSLSRRASYDDKRLGAFCVRIWIRSNTHSTNVPSIMKINQIIMRLEVVLMTDI